MSVATTSIDVYHSRIKGQKEEDQAEVIFKAVQKLQPCTGQMIKKETGLEINIISRAVNYLWSGERGEARIQKYFKAKCPITDIKVWHYTVIGYDGVKVDSKGQFGLF